MERDACAYECAPEDDRPARWFPPYARRSWERSWSDGSGFRRERTATLLRKTEGEHQKGKSETGSKKTGRETPLITESSPANRAIGAQSYTVHRSCCSCAACFATPGAREMSRCAEGRKSRTVSVTVTTSSSSRTKSVGKKQIGPAQDILRRAPGYQCPERRAAMTVCTSGLEA